MENTNNKIKAGIAVLSIAIVLLPYSPLASLPYPAVANFLWFLKTLALILIMRDGTLFFTRPYNYILGLLVIVALFSALIKIMHWPGGDLFLLTVPGVGLIYFIRFAMKKQKILLDWLKMIYVCSVAIASVFFLTHMVDRDILKLATDISYVAMVAGYIYWLMPNQKDTTIAEGE